MNAEGVMPRIEAMLTSIEDALSCITERARTGWPEGSDERARVQAELADIDGRLWELCEVQK
jgi:hypothetical protein